MKSESHSLVLGLALPDALILVALLLPRNLNCDSYLKLHLQTNIDMESHSP